MLLTWFLRGAGPWLPWLLAHGDSSPFHGRESGRCSSHVVVVTVGNHVYFLTIVAWVLCCQPMWAEQEVRGRRQNSLSVREGGNPQIPRKEEMEFNTAKTRTRSGGVEQTISGWEKGKPPPTSPPNFFLPLNYTLKRM